MMVITEVPDILHSGHVHNIDVQNYRGTLIVNSGAWQAQTKYQQMMGIVPSPGIAIVVNLANFHSLAKCGYVSLTVYYNIVQFYRVFLNSPTYIQKLL